MHDCFRQIAATFASGHFGDGLRMLEDIKESDVASVLLKTLVTSAAGALVGDSAIIPLILAAPPLAENLIDAATQGKEMLSLVFTGLRSQDPGFVLQYFTSTDFLSDFGAKAELGLQHLAQVRSIVREAGIDTAVFDSVFDVRIRVALLRAPCASLRFGPCSLYAGTC